MPMHLHIQGREGEDHTAFLGADTTFNVRFLDDDGLPVSLSTGYGLLQFFDDNTRDSTLIKQFVVTPTTSFEASGFGTIKIESEEVDLIRKQYYVWALHDDGTGDSGELFNAQVVNAGTGYSANPTVTVDNTGTGGASGAVTLTIIGGIQTVITITNGGTAYAAAPIVTFNTPAGGTPATATATISSGVVTAINVTNVGSGYSVADPPVITIAAGPGVTATATAKINGGLNVPTISNVGSAYKLPPKLTVVPAGGDTTGTGGELSIAVIRGESQISEIASTVTIQ